jgi:2-polyprenyl-3-methyl-5-hydroxy-6-metoxy-1,4-benzoquinol methylase
MKKQPCNVTSSLELSSEYTIDYYTKDCGGFEAYQKNQGKILEDPRLQAVATLAGIKKKGRVLDLGCGRGELTYYFAKQGFEVTAVDYSTYSIELAKKCFAAEYELQKNVRFYCESVCTVPLQGRYDLVLASDVIEHLSTDELAHLYKRVSEYLKPDGLFIIHTFPNLWYYQYEYPRKKRIATSVGESLPEQPRTSYEMLMHINEQSPRVLNKQLAKYFPENLVWFGEPSHPGGSLLKKFSIKEMRAALSLFAVASHQLIDKNFLIASLQMNPLPSMCDEQLNLSLTESPLEVIVNHEFQLTIQISNNSDFVINSYEPNPVHMAYHWLEEEGLKITIFEGQRSKILPALNPNSRGFYQASIKAPQDNGKYILRLTLVQEKVKWFDQYPNNLSIDIKILVAK